jgi:hypothetical protein
MSEYSWNTIRLMNPVTGEIDSANAEIELNRRLAFLFKNISATQITATLNDLSGILGLGKGGTGKSLSPPIADKIMFYDKSDNAVGWLSLGTNLEISGTTINAVLNLGTLSAMLKSVSGVVSGAVPDTDYQVPLTFASPLSRTANEVGFAGNGVNGSFTTVDGKTVTVTGGLITAIT